MENDSRKTDLWYFPKYTLISCFMSVFSGLASLNYFNVIFVTSVERLIKANSPSDLKIFIAVYFLVPVAEIIGVLTAIKAKRNEEFWYPVAIALIIVAISVTLFSYLIGADYVFRLL